jgi:biotin operon repressor
MKNQKISEDTINTIKYLTRQGWGSRAIAQALYISKTTVNKYASPERRQLPKVLFLDIETAPALVVAFGRYDVTVTQNHVLQEGNWLLSAAWKWSGARVSSIQSTIITKTEASVQDDSRIVMKLRKLIDEADIVVAHNAKGFDMKIIRSRLAVHQIGMYHNVKVIDTLQIAKQMKFPANSLDALAAHLGIGRKTVTSGIDLWIKCMQGDSKALKKMQAYNEDDVDLLVQVYDRLQPYNSSTPNFGVFSADEKHRCPNCGSDAVDYTGNVVYTNQAMYAELSCSDCGAISRTRTNLLSPAERKKQLAKPT